MINPQWREIGHELLEYIKDFMTHGKLPKSVNVTWVCLIPKVSNPECVGDYRPISMVGSIYKIISKSLALRPRSVMAPIIDESQTAFVRDRQILDRIFTANEALSWMKKKKRDGVLFKLDFQSAYDYQMGFPGSCHV